MNKKVKVITGWLAAVVFLIGLVINVNVSLDDPFLLLSDVAVAQTTGSSGDTTGGSGGSGGTSTESYKSNLIPKCKWKTVKFDIDYNGNVITSTIVWEHHTCTNCAKTCDASAPGTCKSDILCPQDSPDPMEDI